MGNVDLHALREAIAGGTVTPVVAPLRLGEIELIGWSGGRPHLEDVARQLERVDAGEVEYLTVRVEGLPVAKGGIDFIKVPGAGTIWQLATHPQLEGLGLATLLIHALEMRAVRRGVRTLRLAVESGHNRVRRLYEHLGYRQLGESEASWEAEADDGSRFLYTATLTEMLKEI